MPLSRLAKVDKFCFDLLSSFQWTLHILSSQAIQFQIPLYALFSQFPWLTPLPFASCFKLHTLTYFGGDILSNDMTILCRRICIIISLIFKTTPTLSRGTSFGTLSTSNIPHIILIIQYPTSYNFASSRTVSSHVSQNIKTKLVEHNANKSSPDASKINPPSQLTYHLTH